jgi:hypothetical protein
MQILYAFAGPTYVCSLTEFYPPLLARLYPTILASLSSNTGRFIPSCADLGFTFWPDFSYPHLHLRIHLRCQCALHSGNVIGTK